MTNAIAFDEALATRIITALVAGNSRRPGLIKNFSSHPEYQIEDLVSEGMVGAMRNWEEYDPSKASPQTFIYQRAHSAIQDLGRTVKSNRNKIKRLKLRLTEEFEPAPGENEDCEDEKPLAEWLIEIQANARKQFGGKQYRSGRKFYRMPQLIAIAGLMKRFSLSARKTVDLLNDREDLREALRLHRVPSHDMITRAMAALENFRLQHTDSDATSPHLASA